MITTAKIIFFSIVFALICLLASYKSYAQVLDYTTVIKIEEGQKITERTFLIQINKKEDNWLSKIKVSHSPSQTFSLIAAKIIDSKGSTLRKLKKKEITTKNDLSHGTFYQDDLIEEFKLYWNEYPYLINYSYRITEQNFLYTAHWYPLTHIGTSTLRSSLRVEIPTNYLVSLDYSNEFQFEESFSGDKRILSWSFGKCTAHKNEIFAPPQEELLPRVSIIPLEFTYGVSGSTKSWTSFGAWLSELNKGTDELTLLEKISIDKLIKGIEDKREIIKVLYHYLQDKTKYINVAIEVGGLKSYPASYVCKNKYGDCKALSTYMKAMLNYVSIESYYTIINAGPNAARITKNLPSQQFNHVILTVPLEADTVWLENTSNTLPFGYIGVSTQNRYALIIGEQNSKLIRIPKLEDTLVLEKRFFNFSINEIGDGKVSISETLRGEAFEGYRYFKSQKSLKDQKERLLSKGAIRNFELMEWDIVDSDREKQKIKTFLAGDCRSQIREIGNLKVISPLQIKVPKFEEPKNRKQDVRINYPINKSDSIVYHMPFMENHKVQLPENIEIKSAFGKYGVSYKQNKNTLIIHEYFLLKRGDYPIEDYPKFYSFIKRIVKHKKTSVIILK